MKKWDKVYRRIYLFAIWLVATLVFAVWISYDRLGEFEKKLASDGEYLHRLISQRADQHDAHLTGLSALASSSKEPHLDLLLNLSETISRFYPRITSIDLVTLRTETPEVVFSTRQSGLDRDVAQQIRRAALASTGALEILPTDSGYLLVKRSPNSDASRYGLALAIKASKLAETDRELSPATSITLTTQDQQEVLVISAGQATGVADRFTRPLQFKKTLGSRSQPLVLMVETHATLDDLMPVGGIVAFAVAMAIILAASAAYMRQRAKASEAERRAVLGEHEARIAQASRINGLGEMASGIAHELNQPLTAILSQSQAGIRLLAVDPNDHDTIAAVLTAVSQQAKRAGDILSRLRNWSTADMQSAQPVNLNDVARGIANLMQSDMKRKGIIFNLTLGMPAPEVLGDPVQIEQVLFNLARNGAEAVESIENATLLISTRSENGQGMMEIIDNGNGIDADILPRLLEPFFTTKSEGMGLGLSLCDGIVARFGGQLKIENRSEGGVCSTVTFPLIGQEKGASSS